MTENQSPVVVMNPTDLSLNQSPLSNYGIDESYQKRGPYRKQCANCGKSETGPPRFKTCALCINIGVKRWEPLFHFYCSRECQKAHWQKHQIEHRLYEAKKRTTPSDYNGDISSQQTVVQPTKISKGIQCNVRDDGKKSDGKTLHPSADEWLPLVSHSQHPSRSIYHYDTKNMKDVATETTDPPKRNKKKAKNTSLLPKKGPEDYSSLSSDNITVVNVNEYPPLDENYTFNSDDSSSGSDAGGSNMYIYMGEDGKKSAVLKKRKKKDKKNFNPRVLFERDKRMRRRKPSNVAPKIKELTADEIDSLAAKCNPKYHANLNRDTNRSHVVHVAEGEKLKHDAHAQKDKNTEKIQMKVSATGSLPNATSSTPMHEGDLDSQQNDSVSNNAGNSKKPVKEKKRYTDAEFMAVTKSSTRSLPTGSSTIRPSAMSLVQRDGGAVISEIKPPLDNPKSMELLKKNMDEMIARNLRSQAHEPIDEMENIYLRALDRYLGMAPATPAVEKPQEPNNKGSKSPRSDEDSALSPLSDDDYHDACTYLKSDSQPPKRVVEPTKGTELQKTKKTNRNMEKDDANSNSATTETEEERLQRILSHINRTTYEKVKKRGDLAALESFCKTIVDSQSPKESAKPKVMKNSNQLQKHVVSAPEDGKVKEVATKVVPNDHEDEPETLVYIVPPYVHSRYPRRVDQYNGADPNDPFVEYSSSQSFVVQKPSRQRDISYIGLLLSEKPNTVITQRYILLKNAAYDGRDIELGIKREVVDINEAGEPLYDDYLIRKIEMRKEPENKSFKNINETNTIKSVVEKQMSNNSTNILKQLTGTANLTSSISAKSDVYQGVSETCVDKLDLECMSTMSCPVERCTANNEGNGGSDSASNSCSDMGERKRGGLPVVEDSLSSKDNSMNDELEGVGKFRVRNSSKEFGDIFSAEAEQQMDNAPSLDLSKVFNNQLDETGATGDDPSETDDGLNLPNTNSEVDLVNNSHTDAFDDPFLIRTAKQDSFPYQFRKEQGCIFIIKQWQDYYY